MNNFWKNLDKPFFCLAPMSDVTDVAFRHMLAKYGKNRTNAKSVVFWTEFVAADGLCNKFARKKLAHMFKYAENERPIVAQVFGANPENMKMACQYIASLGFDGIDINMGCPDKSVVAQGAGAGLIRTPALARKIIQSAHEGIASAGQHIPVSVKTRVGFNKEEIDIWIPELLQENISALIVHLRTKKEESLVPARWDLMPHIIELRNKISPNTLIIGNGDVKDLVEAKEKTENYKCDGVMIGRGIFGNPWFFSGKVDQSKTLNLEKGISLLSKVDALIEHIKIFDNELLKPGHESYAVMKKHFKAYINSFDRAQELRVRLMDTETPTESIRILTSFKKTIK